MSAHLPHRQPTGGGIDGTAVPRTRTTAVPCPPAGSDPSRRPTRGGRRGYRGTHPAGRGRGGPAPGKDRAAPPDRMQGLFDLAVRQQKLQFDLAVVTKLLEKAEKEQYGGVR